MTKKISGAEFPLAKIFSSDFDYVIPSYRLVPWFNGESINYHHLTVAEKRAARKTKEATHV